MYIIYHHYFSLFQKLTHEAGEKVAKQVEPYIKVIRSYGYNWKCTESLCADLSLVSKIQNFKVTQVLIYVNFLYPATSFLCCIQNETADAYLVFTFCNLVSSWILCIKVFEINSWSSMALQSIRKKWNVVLGVLEFVRVNFVRYWFRAEPACGESLSRVNQSIDLLVNHLCNINSC